MDTPIAKEGNQSHLTLTNIKVVIVNNHETEGSEVSSIHFQDSFSIRNIQKDGPFQNEKFKLPFQTYPYTSLFQTKITPDYIYQQLLRNSIGNQIHELQQYTKCKYTLCQQSNPQPTQIPQLPPPNGWPRTNANSMTYDNWPHNI